MPDFGPTNDDMRPVDESDLDGEWEAVSTAPEQLESANDSAKLDNDSLPDELTLEAWVVRITDWPEWPDEEEFGHQDHSPYWPNPKDKANWERAEYDYNITRSKFAARLELVRVALVTLGFIVERNDESSAFKDEDSLIVHVIFQNDLRHKFYYLLRSISGRTMVVDEHYDAYPEGTDVPAPLPLSELARCAVSLDHPETYLKCPDDLIPQKNEAPREWAMRIAFNSERLRNVSRLLETAGGNLELAARVVSGQKRKSKEDALKGIRFVVDGMIVRGGIALMVGDSTVGKSTLATELALTVASGGGEWCGQKVPPENCEGYVVLLSGEDNDYDVDLRVASMDPDSKATRLYSLPMDGRPLEEILAAFDGAKISLLIIDPLRKYMRHRRLFERCKSVYDDT